MCMIKLRCVTAKNLVKKRKFGQASQYIYSRIVGSQRLLPALLNWLKPVNGPFGQSNMHSKLEFLSRAASKESNVPLLKPLLF